MLQDVRFALRLAQKSPGTTFACFLALALAIGGSTAIFSIVYAVLLRPLPFTASHRLVRIFSGDPSDIKNEVSMADYVDWKKQLRSFSQLTVTATTQATLTGLGLPERVVIGQAEANFLPFLGVQPVAGRNFRPGENYPGRNGVALLSWPYWQSHFKGRAALGETLLLDHRPYRIVGILPKSLGVFGRKDIWLPVVFDPAAPINQRGLNHFVPFARLRPGVSLVQANSELRAISALASEQFPELNHSVAQAASLSGSLSGEGIGSSPGHVHQVLWLLFAAVCTVLLIACGNVANIQLLRTWARQQELAVRIAVGAGRARLFRQILIESLLLAFTSALAGAALAAAFVRIFKSLPISALPRLDEIAVNGPVLAFALLIAAGSAALFGLLPAFRASVLPLHEVLKQGMGRTTDSRRHQYLRRSFVAFETGLAVLLLIESGLLLKSFLKASELHPPLVAEHLLTVYFSLPDGRAPSDDLDPLFNSILGQVRALPGVESAAISSDLPFTGTASVGEMAIKGRSPAVRKRGDPLAVWNFISPHYFDTLKTPLLAGTDFDSHSTSANVAIVNQSFVDRILPHTDPLTARISPTVVQPPHWARIIGVVANVPQAGVEKGSQPEAFFPAAYTGASWLALAVRVKGDPERYTHAIQAAVARVNGSAATFLPRSMNEILSRQFLWRRLQTWLVGAFATLAIILAGMGIYVVIAHSVNQRLTEIGLRMALGASPNQILRLVVWQGAFPALLGALAGLLVSFVLSRLTASVLFATSATDPATYLAAITLLLVASLAATCLPALRAARIDPWTALRHE